MQEICEIFLGVKKTYDLCQVKTCKHMCRNITAIYNRGLHRSGRSEMNFPMDWSRSANELIFLMGQAGKREISFLTPEPGY